MTVVCCMSIDSLQQELNSSQRAAVMHSGSHALVLAGAGCGKTKTIIARAAHLISTGVSPQRIQILTFTRRSAAEIVERVRLSIGDRGSLVQGYFPVTRERDKRNRLNTPCMRSLIVGNFQVRLLGAWRIRSPVPGVSCLHNEADDFDWVELLGAGESGTDKDVHELERYKGQSLFSSKGDEVYASRDEESWITHGG